MKVKDRILARSPDPPVSDDKRRDQSAGERESGRDQHYYAEPGDEGLVYGARCAPPSRPLRPQGPPPPRDRPSPPPSRCEPPWKGPFCPGGRPDSWRTPRIRTSREGLPPGVPPRGPRRYSPPRQGLSAPYRPIRAPPW